MLASGLQMLIFTMGMMRRSYLAVALPVFAATAGASAILFWIGYTMSSMEPEVSELDLEEEELGEVEA